jgi:hypothetical protein
MKTLILTITVVCVVAAYYFGLRYFTGQDLGFTPARKYVRNLAKNLLHTEVTAAREAGATPSTTTGQMA